ncbi:MAG: hypothetical protein AVDCRST_MAG88-959, partial [uncultured Thermomicrobiales bacterium]
GPQSSLRGTRWVPRSRSGAARLTRHALPSHLRRFLPGGHLSLLPAPLLARTRRLGDRCRQTLRPLRPGAGGSAPLHRPGRRPLGPAALHPGRTGPLRRRLGALRRLGARDGAD